MRCWISKDIIGKSNFFLELVRHREDILGVYCFLDEIVIPSGIPKDPNDNNRFSIIERGWNFYNRLQFSLPVSLLLKIKERGKII